MKKIFKILCASVAFAALLCVSAFASEPVIAEGKCGDDISWRIIDKSVSAVVNYELVFEGSGVLVGYKKDGTTIGYGTREESQFADFWDHITTAKVGEGITAIGGCGLAFFPSLDNVELPKSVTKIGGAAFEACTSLRSIYRSGAVAVTGANLQGIESIGAYAFDGCKRLSRVVLDENFKGKLDVECFKGTGIVNIVIPEGVTSLERDAFKNCGNLMYVQFNGDPKIDEGAFTYSGNMKTIYGKAGGNAEAFAKARGLEFRTDRMNESLGGSEDAIAIGVCGDEVYWQILNEGTAEAPVYLFDVFGTGITMEALDASGKQIEYGTSGNLLWNDYIPYIKKARVGGNVTTLGKAALFFLRYVEYIELSPKVKHLGSAVFEGDFSLRSVYITGNEPVDGVADLSNILTHGAYQFDGCKNIKNVIFSENMEKQEMPTEMLKATSIVDFVVPKQFTFINYDAFENCKKLTTLRFFGDPELADNALSHCTALKEIYGITGGNVEEYAKAHGITFISPMNIKIYEGDELIYNIGAVEGSTFEEMNFGGDIYMLYRDKALEVPYKMSDKITGDLTLYASPLLEFKGHSVRVEKYNGLRSMYDLRLREIEGNSVYTVVEMGAFASAERGVRMFDLTLDMNYIHKASIVADGRISGRLSSAPENGIASFTLSAVGYEKDGVIRNELADDELYSRGYVVLRDKESGKEYTVYTDIFSANLVQTAANAETDGLSEAEKLFVEKAASVTVPENKIYSKEELISILSSVYNGRESFIVGQHCDVGNADSFADFIDEFYNETGEIPGVIALDQGTMNRAGIYGGEDKETIISDIIGYAERGGIFSLSFHMDNPLDESLYCRGELGFEEAWEELMTEGTPSNESLMRSLATAADTLEMLEAAGVPVLWRPLHEMNGGWFWWCTIQTAEGETKALDASYITRLWKYFYNYFENECGLTNLIWVYSPNFTNSTVSPVPVMYCYPGDEYVDLVGCDWYTTHGTLADIDGAGKSYSSLTATGKITAVTEFGVRGPLASNSQNVQEKLYNCMNELETYKSMLDAGHGVAYVLNWSGTSSSPLYLGKAAEFMAAEETLGGEDILNILQELRK